MWIEFGAFTFFISLLFAFFEIEIEGKFGWANKLPTWYRKSGFSKLFYLISGKKPLTGYHLFLYLFTLLFFHSLFFFGIDFSIELESKVFLSFFLFLIVEDYLWFIFNPYFGIKKFKRKNIWWHKNMYWIFNKVPINHINGFVLLGILTYIISEITNDFSIFYGYLTSLGVILFLSLISLLFEKPYHKWYKKMRKIDERKYFSKN